MGVSEIKALMIHMILGRSWKGSRRSSILPNANSLFKTGVCLLQETLHKHNIEDMEESATEQMSVVWPQCSKSTEGKSSKRRYSVGFSESLTAISNPSSSLQFYNFQKTAVECFPKHSVQWLRKSIHHLMCSRVDDA